MPEPLSLPQQEVQEPEVKIDQLEKQRSAFDVEESKFDLADKDAGLDFDAALN